MVQECIDMNGSDGLWLRQLSVKCANAKYAKILTWTREESFLRIFIIAR